MAGRGSAEDFTTLGIERRKRAKASRADNIQNRAALRALGSRATQDPTYPMLQGQHRIQPIQCLNGTFQSRRRTPLH
jgi:hypothetical protein